MIRTYKYRIYPSLLQRQALQETLRFCRFLYNSALEERISYYKKFGKSISYFTQANSLPEIKEMFATETANINSQVLQQTLMQLNAAYQNFFTGVKKKSDKVGFPRFKGVNRFKSICYPQPLHDLSGGCIKKLENGKLRIAKLGEVKIKWHRPIQGRCKQVRIIQQADKYFICFACEDVPANILPATGKTTAIDLGIINFITTDDGTKFHHPKPYKTAKEKLAYHNRKLAAKRRGSKNREKQIITLQRAHQKVHNVRMDFQHKLSTKLVRENDSIIIEKLNIKNMLESKGFEVNKQNISDASWGSFATLLNYKAASAGRTVIEVDPRNTSRNCSRCANTKENLTLADREYHCEACGLAMDRDRNAALNILGLGTSLVKAPITVQVSEAFDL